jgi:thioredoxin reductase (NADPH)
MKKFDILIIGAGPIGLACALEAKQAGLSYILIEKGALVNSLYHYPANMTFFSTSEKLEIGDIPFVSNNSKPTRNEALEYYRRVAQSHNLNVQLFETVIAVKKQENVIARNVTTEGGYGYKISTSKKEYLAKNIILCTGFYDIPSLLGIEGENLPKVTHYYKEPHFYFKQKVVIVGANNSAVDAALETYRKGADVTMVVREAEIGQRVKYWARPDIVNRITEGSIKAYFNSSLKAIRLHEVDIETPDGVVTLENDFVIAATGYQPNFDFLKKIGIQLSNDEKLYPTYNKETQESNIPHIYLAGVVCGGMDTHVWFIENSRVHAKQIIQNILKTTKSYTSNPLDYLSK